MLTNTTTLRVLTIAFMIIIGYALARAFYYGSFLGIVLALVSLGAAIYFFYIVAEIRKEMEKDKAY